MSKEEKINITSSYMKKTLKGHINICEWNFPDFPFVCDIYIEDDTKILSKQIININNIKGTINFFSNNNTDLVLKLGLICNNMNNLEIINNINGNNNNSEIRLRVINLSDEETILKTKGVILPQTLNNVFLEEVKVLINDKSNVICLPDLIVQSNNAIANHNVTMRCFSDDELFY